MTNDFITVEIQIRPVLPMEMVNSVVLMETQTYYDRATDKPVGRLMTNLMNGDNFIMMEGGQAFIMDKDQHAKMVAAIQLQDTAAVDLSQSDLDDDADDRYQEFMQSKL